MGFYLENELGVNYDLDWYFGLDSVLIKKQVECLGTKREEISMAGHCLFPRHTWAIGTASTHKEKTMTIRHPNHWNWHRYNFFSHFLDLAIWVFFG